ncbi:MAG: hypothetical protein RR478_00870 [Bacilli bacterium]
MDNAKVNVVTTQLDKLKKRIPYNNDIFINENSYLDVLNCLLDDTKIIALSVLFPFEDYSTMELPNNYLNWQLRACIELYNIGDKAGITSYSENGISWSKNFDGLSVSLMNELVPKIGAVKRKVVI